MITVPQLAPKDHTPPPISNRESEAAIFAPRRPLQGAKGEQKANREPLRLEIDVTPTKQRLGLRSNRELEAFFSPLFAPKTPLRQPKKANKRLIGNHYD
jgi:hypothetical protein